MRHSIFPALAATEAEALQEIYSRTARGKVIEVIKATIEGLDYAWTQREGSSEIIARWINLNPAQAANTYDSVRDAFSRAGIPTDEQTKPYIAMLGTTAGLKGDMSPAVIFDFFLPPRRQKKAEVSPAP
jgi:hypothetical protein